MADASTVFGGMLGKASGEIKSRKSKLDKMEEDATKAEAPDWNGSNLMKPSGDFDQGSFLHPRNRGSTNGY